MLLLCFEGYKYGRLCWSEVAGDNDDEQDVDADDDHDDGVTGMIMTRMMGRP